MKFHQHSLSFSPCVPDGFGRTMTLDNFAYRKSILSISVKGTGDEVRGIELDGKRLSGNSIPADLVGKHTVSIIMSGRRFGEQGIDLKPVDFSPETPVVSVAGSELHWSPVGGAVAYSIYRNGKKIATTTHNHYRLSVKTGYSEYQVMAVAGNGLESFLSEPVSVTGGVPIVIVQAEQGADSVRNKFSGYTGAGYIRLDLEHHDSPEYKVDIKTGGLYAIDVRYANGEGPINTDNKCAIRTLNVDHHAVGPVVLPQRGAGDWTSWGYSNVIHVSLSSGVHLLSISFDKHDNNMNRKTNTALVDAIRLTMISKR
jgi:hypothetical protein